MSDGFQRPAESVEDRVRAVVGPDADYAARLRELAAETADPVERDALLDTAAEVAGLSLTGDGHSRAVPR